MLWALLFLILATARPTVVPNCPVGQVYDAVQRKCVERLQDRDISRGDPSAPRGPIVGPPTDRPNDPPSNPPGPPSNPPGPPGNPPGDKPGHGYGDPNHGHTGPPGQDKDRGPKK